MSDRQQLYVEVASEIKMLLDNTQGVSDVTLSFLIGIGATARAVADVFERRSRSFDRALFLRNCGLEEGT